jgi:hypothetical protein
MMKKIRSMFLAAALAAGATPAGSGLARPSQGISGDQAGPHDPPGPENP